MYTFSEIFVGIPLSQFGQGLNPSRSKNIINELSEYVGEDLSLERLEVFLDDASEDVKEILNRLIEFRDGNTLPEFQDFITDYKLDFRTDYNGGDENPSIFGFYINELMPIPDVGLAPFSEDVRTIYMLKDRMELFCYSIFGEKNYKDLEADKMIGVFWNNHSS
jgi:hypothetical protein